MTPTPDEIDDLLVRSGAAWRDGQPDPRPVDPALFTTSPSRGWLPAAAAAAVVAVVAAGVTVAVVRTDAPALTAAPASTTTTAPASGPFAPLLVRDGDRVAVSGAVQALPGRPVRICPPLGSIARLSPDPAPVSVYCEVGVTVRGLDLATIADRKLDRGAVTGGARVEGRYVDGVITVTRQAVPDPDPQRPSPFPAWPPCAAPVGGWWPGDTEEASLTRYLSAHPEHYVDFWVTYPDGQPKPQDGSKPWTEDTTVPVVGTVLDPAVAETALRKIHPGNLCVVRVPRSAATLNAVFGRLLATDLREHGAYTISPDGVTGRVNVDLVVLDPSAQRWLAQADDRTGAVSPHPWVTPLR